MVATYYKLARPDGFDFFTGETINYRENIGKSVMCPNGDKALGVCSAGVIHASVKPNDCFVGARIPCSAYLVSGKPVCGDEQKHGFLKLQVLHEITDLDSLFGWKYTEACNPINPLKGRPEKVNQEQINSLHVWPSLWASVWPSLWASVGGSVRQKVWPSVRASVMASLGQKVWPSVMASVRASVWQKVWPSVRASVWASVGAYVGSLFPKVGTWKYINHAEGEYPFQAAVDLWRAGFVPSYDYKTWRLHSGKNASVVYEEQL